jgi:elongation factor P
MLDYINIKPKKIIVFEGDPYEVLTSHTMKKNRQKPSNQTKLRNLKTGAVVEKAFHQSDKVMEAEIENKNIKYLYSNKGEWWFCAENDPSDRFTMSETQLGDNAQYLKENEIIEAMEYDEEIIGIKLPAKINVRVVEAPPSIKGNTSSGGSKPVVVETGATVDTPLFIEAGDIIRINTETGLYSERIEKA